MKVEPLTNPKAKPTGLARPLPMSDAEQANAGKIGFRAAASHDLRQPLQTISLLQGLLERHAQDDVTRELLRRLDDVVPRLGPYWGRQPPDGDPLPRRSISLPAVVAVQP